MGTFLVILYVVLWLIGASGYIWLLFEAYGDDSTMGWLCLFFMPFGIYYCLTQVEGRTRWYILALWLGGSIPGAIVFQLAQKY